MADGFARNAIRISDGVNDNEADVIDNKLQTNAALKDSNGDNIDVQNPLPVDGDSVYVKDIDLENSSSVNWTGGDVRDLFNDLNTQLVNSTTDNPKTLVITLQRTIVTNGVSIGSNQGGSYSNVKCEIQQGGASWTTVRDESANPVPFTARFFSFSQTVGNDVIGVVGVTALRITFNTANTISLTSLNINKSRDVNASLVGVKPDGITTYIGATNNSNLKISVQEYGDTPAIDAFARLRTSEPFTIFDSKQLHDKQPLFWDEEIGGSATSTHSSTDADVEMTVTANANDYVIRQTKQRFNYQPGKSQLVFFTFQSPQVSGVDCRMGLFDGIIGTPKTPNNGIFFECNGSLSWNIAKNGSIAETVTQSNWNVDPLDGTGRSGITLDMTATLIGILDFEWLGVGRVRVGFVIDGLVYYCHYFNHANDSTFTSVYMSTPNLPVRYTIETDGTNGSTLKHICSSVISEGGIEKTGILRTVDTGNTYLTTLNTGNSYALIGIRLKAAYNDVTIIPEGLSIFLGTNDSFKWELHLNPTVAGTFTYNDLTNSAVQYAVGGNINTISANGIVIASGGGSTSTRQSDSDLQTALRIGQAIDGTMDTLVLVIRPFSTNLSAWAGLNFRELL
jgi:hypothetical protein